MTSGGGAEGVLRSVDALLEPLPPQSTTMVKSSDVLLIIVCDMLFEFEFIYFTKFSD